MDDRAAGRDGVQVCLRRLPIGGQPQHQLASILHSLPPDEFLNRLDEGAALANDLRRRLDLLSLQQQSHRLAIAHILPPARRAECNQLIRILGEVADRNGVRLAGLAA